MGVNQPAPTGGAGNANNTSSGCFEVKYYDNTGAEIGTTLLVPGANHGAVPDGAVSFTGVSKPCPPPATTTTCGIAHRGGHGSSAQSELIFKVVGGPLVFVADSQMDNAVYDLDVRAQNPDEARELARQALLSPIGSPVDRRISIVTWLRVQQVFGAGKLIGVARAPFTQFRLTWNEAASYSDLPSEHNALQTELPYGLWTVEANVALGDVNGHGDWNRAVVELQHAGVSSSQLASCGMRFVE